MSNDTQVTDEAELRMLRDLLDQLEGSVDRLEGSVSRISEKVAAIHHLVTGDPAN